MMGLSGLLYIHDELQVLIDGLSALVAEGEVFRIGGATVGASVGHSE